MNDKMILDNLLRISAGFFLNKYYMLYKRIFIFIFTINFYDFFFFINQLAVNPSSTAITAPVI